MISLYYIFNSFFGFINNKKCKVYNFLITVIKELYIKYSIKELLIFIINYCKEIKALIVKIFLKT